MRLRSWYKPGALDALVDALLIEIDAAHTIQQSLAKAPRPAPAGGPRPPEAAAY